MTTTPELVSLSRRLPVGVELHGKSGCHFRVWAADHERVTLVIESESGAVLEELPLAAEGDGYFSALVPAAHAGTLYRYRLGASTSCFPDPASRAQPFGPHGPSQVVDPNAFVWTDQSWGGVNVHGQVLYELHVGTFTPEGTWRAAMDHLQSLVEIGMTTIEMMPVAEFSGRFGWGYDGVDLFAPTHLYGTPDDLRRFVDRAHGLGLGVILDVVYNHLGPDGNYLAQFSRSYFTNRYKNEWGDAINFDDGAAPVREFVCANAGYWIDEFHFDGLRLDATQQIFDESQPHVLADVAARARSAAGRRSIIIVAENEPQDVRVLRSPKESGFGLDAMWNDDFHHATKVALTGRREAYYTDYFGTPQEFISCAKHGFLYQGQMYSWQRHRRGTLTTGFSPDRFVIFLDNHDQVANAPSGLGARVHQQTGPGLYRTVTAMWLLSPGTPMFFQGQEFAASSPFMYFADHDGELGAAVQAGRAKFMSQFRSAAMRPLVEELPDPRDRSTFARCKLDHAERAQHVQAVALHRDLLRLRRELTSLTQHGTLDGAVISDRAFALRWFGADRLLLVNLGAELILSSVPQPLLASPTSAGWAILWSSEDSVYGGAGTAPIETDEGWRIPGQAAVLLAPRDV
ncbi:MAG TPA: malto-oligosyltrehalose trehalohydrolase [Vicinamibacterales bacterium]